MTSNLQIQRICRHCRADFTARTTVTKYCSLRCAQRAYKVRARAKKVQESEQETRRVLAEPIQEIGAKFYLSIPEAAKLLGVSRRPYTG